MSARLLSARCLRPAALGLRRCCSPLVASAHPRAVIPGLAKGVGGGGGGARRWRSSVWEDKSPVAGGKKRGSSAPKASSDFAFAFDIDGVLLHSSAPLPGAAETLRFLQQHAIPFILLTNGGGKPESERVAELSSKLGVPLDVSNFVQSHTPYHLLANPNPSALGGDETPLAQDLERFLAHTTGKTSGLGSDATVLVLGSDASKARRIAQGYGFASVVTPGDILAAHPEVFPFNPLRAFYAAQEIMPLPRPLHSPHCGVPLEECLKIDAVLVFNDPRDWAVDIQLVVDLMLSHRGYMGTYSAKNGRGEAGRRWQNDGQPALVFSNCDLLWSTGYHLSRFGQGAFRRAVSSVFTEVTAQAGDKSPAELVSYTFGKPWEITYAYAHNVLRQHAEKMRPNSGSSGAAESAGRVVYMVGDNPHSDIRGAIRWDAHLEQHSGHQSWWRACLVRTGVWSEATMPLETLRKGGFEPHTVQDDVRGAVNWALAQHGWKDRVE